jgi:uncharacterized membrane protein YphA (DoxX/SURF4 family)
VDVAHPLVVACECARFSARVAALLIRLWGLLFIIAGLEKAGDASGLSRVLEFYRFSPALVTLSVWVVTLGEVVLGTLLVIQPLSRKLIYVLVGTLIFYSANLCILLFSEGAPSCGCGSLVFKYQEGRAEKIAGVVRNSVLLLGAGWALYVSRPRRSGGAPEETAFA